MAQLLEFMGNHVWLFLAFFMTLGMLGYLEYTKLTTGKTALGPYDATQKMNGGEALFVDVRDESEFKTGHLLNAKSVPLSKFAERLHELEKYKEKELVIYCDNGVRTARALSKLKKGGFTQLFSLAGGLVAWEKASLPTVTK